MKTKTTGTLSFAAASLLALSVSVSPAAVTHTWSLHEDDPENIFTNALHFPLPPGDIPACDRVDVRMTSGDVTVRMPAGSDCLTTLAPFFMAENAGTTLTLDFKDATLTQRDTDAANPYAPDGRFLLGHGRSSVFTYAWGGHTLNGAYRLEDALLTISNGVGGARSVDFLRGTFDFLAPNAVTNASAYLYIGAGAMTDRPFDLNFRGETSFRAPIFFIYATAPTNRIGFLGGKHYVSSFQMRTRDSGGNDTYERTRVTVAGEGTELKVADFTANAGTSDHGYRVCVRDGGTLKAAGSISQRAGAGYPFVFDGGRFDTEKRYLIWHNACVFATNAFFRLNEFALNQGRVSLTDSDVGSGYTTLGVRENTGTTEIAMDGGCAAFTHLRFGSASGSSGRFALLRGTVDVSYETLIGVGAGGRGTLSVAGGEFRDAGRIIVGGLGSGEIHVSGGSLTTPGLYFVWNDASRRTTNVLHMTGGRVRAENGVGLVVTGGADETYAGVVLEGGVLETAALYGGAGCSGADPAKTNACTLVGDGGTLRATAASDGFVRDLTSASCGPAGLTLDSAYAVTVPQSFSDLDGRGGELVLTGDGVKTLSGTATSVSNIVVAGGTVVFAAGARAASNLIVTNGARVVFMTAPEDIGIRSFVCGDAASAGTLTLVKDVPLDFGAAPVSFGPSFRLALDGAFAAGFAAETLVKTTAPVSDASMTAWRTAFGGTGFLPDLSYGFTCATSDDGTSFGLTVATAAHTFTVGEGQVTDGEAVAVGPMQSIVADVAADATLTLTGMLSQGGLLKKGDGGLFLENAGNVFIRGLVSEAGFFSVGTPGASGLSAASMNGLVLYGGTFEYVGDGTPAVFPGPMTVSLADKNAPFGIKTESPLTIADITVTGGALVKRGAAPLTFAPAKGESLRFVDSKGASSSTDPNDPSSPYSIGDISGRTDLRPTSGFMGINVAEGELRLVGDADTRFEIQGGAMIGISATGGRAQPALTIDGAVVDFKWASVQLGGFIQAGSFNSAPRLSIVNGADVSTYIYFCGRNPGMPCYPTVTVDRATWKIADFRPGYGYQAYPRYFVADSDILADTVLCYGPSYFHLTNSVLSVAASGVAEMHDSGGTWTFGEGSRLELSHLKTTASNPSKGFTLRFDGGTWETRGSDKVFRLYMAERFNFETGGDGGLTLPVGDGATVPVSRAITGSGRVVKTGPGTLAFDTQGTWTADLTEKTELDDPVTLAFAGELDVREGAVTVAGGACRAGGAYRAAPGASIDFGGNALTGASFAAAGTFRNATVADATVAASDSENAAPTFDGVAFSGKVTVDFGRTDDDRDAVEPFAVARFTGSGSPDLSLWRGRAAGKGNAVLFTAADGVVYAEIKQAGFTLLVR